MEVCVFKDARKQPFETRESATGGAAVTGPRSQALLPAAATRCTADEEA